MWVQSVSSPQSYLHALAALLHCCNIPCQLKKTPWGNPMFCLWCTRACVLWERLTRRRQICSHGWSKLKTCLISVPLHAVGKTFLLLPRAGTQLLHFEVSFLVNSPRCSSANTSGLSNEQQSIQTCKWHQCPLLLDNEQQTLVNLPSYVLVSSFLNTNYLA